MSRAASLRLRARLAAAIGADGDARLLAGYARAIADDPAPNGPTERRVRARIVDHAEANTGDPARALIWADALRDLGARPAPAGPETRARVLELEAEVNRLRAALEGAKAAEGPLLERLAAQALGDGRSWLDLAGEVARAERCEISALLTRDRSRVDVPPGAPLPRHRFWAALSARRISHARIGRVLRLDATTVNNGVRRARAEGEARAA